MNLARDPESNEREQGGSWPDHCQMEPMGLRQRHVSCPFWSSTFHKTLQNSSLSSSESALHHVWSLALLLLTSP